ncbi:MAG: riboflavin biosynthesis protein RibF [Akkermansia sp.]|nr:riboflavin biosynthesis protein RibF [Akkermansia sp.]
MKVLHSIEELAALNQSVHWAMGFFDGVHRGHRRVIESADTPGALRGVLTFAQHPLAVLAPQKQPKLITPAVEQKRALLAGLGVQVLLELPFTPELAAMAPREFLDALRSACGMAGISVGRNWHFGKGGVGNAAFVEEYAAEHGLRACVQDMAELQGERICSSRIRELLVAGNLPLAQEMLGHAFTLSGVVEPGQKLARKLGFPTANMQIHPAAVLPPFGVYEVAACIEGAPVRGIANLGLRPTIDEAQKLLRLETHLLDWQGDLYGLPLLVELRRFLRPERRFSSVAELQARIAADIQLLSLD